MIKVEDFNSLIEQINGLQSQKLQDELKVAEQKVRIEALEKEVLSGNNVNLNLQNKNEKLMAKMVTLEQVLVAEQKMTVQLKDVVKNNKKEAATLKQHLQEEVEQTKNKRAWFLKTNQQFADQIRELYSKYQQAASTNTHNPGSRTEVIQEMEEALKQKQTMLQQEEIDLLNREEAVTQSEEGFRALTEEKENLQEEFRQLDSFTDQLQRQFDSLAEYCKKLSANIEKPCSFCGKYNKEE